MLHNSVNILKTTELYTSNVWILWRGDVFRKRFQWFKVFITSVSSDCIRDTSHGKYSGGENKNKPGFPGAHRLMGSVGGKQTLNQYQTSKNSWGEHGRGKKLLFHRHSWWGLVLFWQDSWTESEALFTGSSMQSARCGGKLLRSPW